jgi:hypothetical protein
VPFVALFFTQKALLQEEIFQQFSIFAEGRLKSFPPYFVSV